MELKEKEKKSQEIFARLKKEYQEQQAKKDVEKFLMDTCGAYGVYLESSGDMWHNYYLEHLVVSVNCKKDIIGFENKKYKSQFRFCAPTQFKEALMKALDGTLWQ